MRNGFAHRPARAALAILVALAAMALATESASAYPNPGTVAGDTMIHDPSMAIRASAPRYIVYGTGNQSLISNDRITFADGGPIFVSTPSWWSPYITQGTSANQHMWAPDVSFHNGQWWMYYAVSKGDGSGTSAIGLATSPTALPNSWTDHGKVISAPPPAGQPRYNSIDPNLVVDASGKWWLVFGSFFDGIFIAPLNPATGMLADPTALPTQIAKSDDLADAIEGAVVFQHTYNGATHYYLFASFGYCCRTDATQDTYTIRVGQSTSPTGPYTYENGNPMLGGAPSPPVMASHGYVWAPGGESVVHDSKDGHDLLVYHYLDNRLQYKPFLGINFLGWDAQGFPYAY